MFLIYSVKVVIFLQMTKFLPTYFRTNNLYFRMFNFCETSSKNEGQGCFPRLE